VIKPFTLSMAGLLMSSWALASPYGDYARETLDTLINDYPGRYRDTANFADAADWMERRMGTGYSVSRQNFSWNADGENRSSQNVLAEATGSSGRKLIVGAHFDTYFDRPTLQGLDDNASGAGVLTELAHNLSGLSFEDGVTFIGFGAEEEGMYGSKAYVHSLDAAARSRLTGMINLDSLVTGDLLYANAATNIENDPALAALREHSLRIAREMGIELHINPGLHPNYPEGTGCCSDGDSFRALDIPVLYVEATNWNIGDRDGYTQTDNPAIPEGFTWHVPERDNETALTTAFGKERITQRLEVYSRLLTRLILEATSTDLRYSSFSGAKLMASLEDTLARQQRTLQRLHERRRLALRSSVREEGSFDGGLGVEGQLQPRHGFDDSPNQRSRQATVYLFGDRQHNEWLIHGVSLSFTRGKDRLEHSGEIASDTWQAGTYALLGNGRPQWLSADLRIGRARLDADRSVFIQSQSGSVLLNQKLPSDTHGRFWGTRLQSGYDFLVGGVRTGPVIGFDYQRHTINGFREKPDRRTALRFEGQRFDSRQVNLGWQLQSQFVLPDGHTLLPYANLTWVRELGHGSGDGFNLHSQADGSLRRIDNPRRVDKHFAQAHLGTQLALGRQLNLDAQAGGRLKHKDGKQAGYNLSLQYRF